MAEPATAGSAGETGSGTGTGTRVTIGIPTEIAPGERRVSLIPETVGRLVKQGARVIVQAGAGEGAFFLDGAYTAAGAELVPDARGLYQQSDLVLKIHRPQPGPDGVDEVDLLRPGSALIAFLYPLFNPDLAEKLAAKNITSFSMDAVPRTTRAQYMDALSAMSTVAGYKASLLAADHLSKFFPLLMTAAGTIAPAKVLIIGAGVAGLQAIGTCRRLGAVVEAYDTRPVVKEQVESLGAKFVEIDTGATDTQTAGGYAREMTPDEIRRQQEGLAARAAQADCVITTALIPGRPAPLLITEEAVRGMRPGSVVVDLAGETGGNCALSVPGETVVRHHVTIMAPLNLPAELPVHASQMYAKNLQNLLALMVSKDGRFQPDWNDDIVAATVITRDGEIVHEGTRKRLGLAPLTPPAPEPAPEPAPAAETQTEQATAATEPPAEPELSPPSEAETTPIYSPAVETAAATSASAFATTEEYDATELPTEQLPASRFGTEAFDADTIAVAPEPAAAGSTEPEPLGFAGEADAPPAETDAEPEPASPWAPEPVQHDEYAEPDGEETGAEAPPIRDWRSPPDS
jgi:NAD(P) transhydrogenase subunit alpha